MFKKSMLIIVFCLLTLNSFAQSPKDAINELYIKRMALIKNKLSSGCLTALSPIIGALNESHLLFLNDKPLDATLGNLELIHNTLPKYKNLGCHLSDITDNTMTAHYLSYYLDLTSRHTSTPKEPQPTDYEKIQLVNVANSISTKLNMMCNKVLCDDKPNVIIKETEYISKEMRSEHPDYHTILNITHTIKAHINVAYHHHKINDKRYYEALSWVLFNMNYLYKVPKKYLFDERIPHDFRHQIASTYTNYLMNYTNMSNLDASYLSNYNNYFNYPPKDTNMDVLLAIYLELVSNVLRDDYYSHIKDASSKEYLNYLVEWFKNETYAHFKSFYEQQMGQNDLRQKS